ncbi:hypothetical protein K503DRAFT_431336, partial [Rhizopogon vinicolor AM-OR11-026]
GAFISWTGSVTLHVHNTRVLRERQLQYLRTVVERVRSVLLSMHMVGLNLPCFLISLAGEMLTALKTPPSATSAPH